jgi:hypothetical protein
MASLSLYGRGHYCIPCVPVPFGPSIPPLPSPTVCVSLLPSLPCAVRCLGPPARCDEDQMRD